MKLTEIEKEKLTKSLEDILHAVTEFLGIDLEYDYNILSYETKEGEERELMKVNLYGDQEGLLIGYHGKTLDDIQQLISLGMSTAHKQIVKVVLDVSGYREKRKSTLENLARRAQQQVIESGQEMQLEPMNPAERRIIHQVINDDGRAKTESIGEGRDRRIVILPLDGAVEDVGQELDSDPGPEPDPEDEVAAEDELGMNEQTNQQVDEQEE